ncbi:MAG TPA: galactose-1-phosphate uridylyltransferase [Conexivisphaerales archaeon]|nr:galactose-1-phosphate uridylyltransferase [Conexivisphaerales archaeon]
MPELRVDYVSKSMSLVPSEKRRGRPSEDGCSYCKGKEESTPPADLVLQDRFGGIVKTSDGEDSRVKEWVVRVFKHPEPLVFDDSRSNYSDEPLFGEPARGSHYVVVSSPNHDDTFSRMSIDQLSDNLIALQEQLKFLYQGRGVSYVAAFMDSETGKGTASHPHIDLVSFSRIPPVIEQESKMSDSVYEELGQCPYCRLVQVESGGPRQILSSENFLAFVPWAPMHDYEFWIVPRKHQKSFLKMTQHQVKDMAMMLRCTLGGLSAGPSPNYHVAFHFAPEKRQQSQFHWHVEVYPDLAKRSALAEGFGVHVNSSPPEMMADELGSASRKEVAKLLGVK